MINDAVIHRPGAVIIPNLTSKRSWGALMDDHFLPIGPFKRRNAKRHGSLQATVAMGIKCSRVASRASRSRARATLLKIY